MIGWTPPNSQMNLGSVLIPEAVARAGMSPATYQYWLAQRIQEMVQREAPDRTKELLREAEAIEPALEVSSHLDKVGLTMVAASSWLQDRAGMPNFPVPGPISNDPETVEQIKETDLQQYLSALYYDPI